MKYIITEYQCYENGTVGTLNYDYDNELDANHKYHEILMYATKSEILAHGAVMFNSEGVLMKGEGFKHEIPEPESEQIIETENESAPISDEAYADDLENGNIMWGDLPEERRTAVDAILRQDVEDGKITQEKYTEITGFPYDY